MLALEGTRSFLNQKFFLLLLRILFFSSSALPGVCVHIYIYYIYYKYQRNYISILGWEDGEGSVRRGGTLPSPQPAGRQLPSFLPRLPAPVTT